MRRVPDLSACSDLPGSSPGHLIIVVHFYVYVDFYVELGKSESVGFLIVCQIALGAILRWLRVSEGQAGQYDEIHCDVTHSSDTTSSI